MLLEVSTPWSWSQVWKPTNHCNHDPLCRELEASGLRGSLRPEGESQVQLQALPEASFQTEESLPRVCRDLTAGCLHQQLTSLLQHAEDCAMWSKTAVGHQVVDNGAEH